MKSITLFIFTLLFCFTAAHSQKRIFGKGQTDIQFGIGVLPTSAILNDAEMKLLPVQIEAATMLGSNMSLGAFYNRASYDTPSPAITSDGLLQVVNTNFSQAGLKGAVHITSVTNADFYGGFFLAYNMINRSVNQGNMDFLEEHYRIKPEDNRLFYSGFVGAKYAFLPRWLAFGEFALGESLLTAGIGFRL